MVVGLGWRERGMVGLGSGRAGMEGSGGGGGVVGLDRRKGVVVVGLGWKGGW